MGFDALTEKQHLCIACSKCCREIGVYTHYNLYDCSEKDFVQFYETRGFKVTKSEEVFVLTLKLSCPHLTPVGCDIYEKRPQVCRDYSGLNDFGSDCFWAVLPEDQKKTK